MSYFDRDAHVKAIMDLVRVTSKREKLSCKEWVTRDEYGSWEKRAKELSEKTHERRVELGFNDEAWTKAICNQILYEATQALFERAKKTAKRP